MIKTEQYKDQFLKTLYLIVLITVMTVIIFQILVVKGVNLKFLINIFISLVAVCFGIVLGYIYLQLKQKKKISTIIEELRNYLLNALKLYQGKLKYPQIANADFRYPNYDGLLEGNEKIQSGNFESAEIFLRKELLRDPEYVNVWVSLARTMLELERFEEALRYINFAISLDMENPRFNNMGQLSMLKSEILIKLERYEEAEDIIRNAILTKNPYSMKAKSLLKECS